MDTDSSPDSTSHRLCAECGNEFKWVRKKGRPPVVCSLECKTARRTRQFRKSDDRKLARVDRSGKCARCGSDFEQPAAPGGRRTYCGEDCSKAALLEQGSRNQKDWRRRVVESGAECSVNGCKKPPTASKGLCGMHYMRLLTDGDVGQAEPLKVRGVHTWSKRRDGYVVRGNGRHVELQHRVVMEEIIGRPLIDGENVHHKNGIRHDNRPENLEMWYVSPRPGQRVADMIDYVVEFHSDEVRLALRRLDE